MKRPNIKDFEKETTEGLIEYLHALETYCDYIEDVNSYLDRISKAALEVFLKK